MTPKTKKWAWIGGVAAGSAALVGAIVLWPRKAMAATPIAFLPSKAQPQSVNLNAPLLLHEGDNGAFLLRPTADFLWIKVPDKFVQEVQNTPQAGDAIFYAGNFQPLWEKRENGQLYLMIPPGTPAGDRGAMTLSLGDEKRLFWQALVTLVAA
jgi:hypothetical protein